MDLIKNLNGYIIENELVIYNLNKKCIIDSSRNLFTILKKDFFL